MNGMTTDRVLAILAALSALTVAVMVISILSTGASQDFFQTARSIDAYTAFVTGKPLSALGLRLNLGLDNLFIIFYSTFFIMLAARLRGTVDDVVLLLGLGTMMLTAVLDAVENHHIMSMVHAIEHGYAITVAEGQAQMVASQVKFHSSYLSAFLFSFGLMRLGRLGRLIAITLWCYIPFGIVISVAPVELAKPLVLGRTIFFVLAFILSAVLFGSLARHRPADRAGIDSNRVKPAIA